MTKEQAMVLEFHEKFGQPWVIGLLRPLSPATRALRVGLLKEEVSEFAEAAAFDDAVGMIDGLCDIIYVAHGAALCMGVDLEPFFAEVHRSNMAKEGGGKRADGKILKPPGWTPPDIAGLLRPLR